MGRRQKTPGPGAYDVPKHLVIGSPDPRLSSNFASKVPRTLHHTEVYGLRTDIGGKKLQVLRGAEETGGDVIEGDTALREVGGPADSDAAAAVASKGRNAAADMKRSLNDQFSPQGVAISDVIITGVQLQQMAEKTTVIANDEGALDDDDDIQVHECF